jgi:cellulose synthase/poly-beta-1,6-N-acetylglucosamine synthase-like glycosyltransferase
MAISILSFVLLFAYYCLISYYHNAWTQIPVFNPSAFQPSEKISVLIPARNEEGNIQHCLNGLLRQTYPAHLLEIIVIDDHSTDSTAAVVRQYHSRGVELLLLKDALADDSSTIAYKKKAIEAGIAKATGTLMVTTDADCTANENWIATVAAFHAASKAFFLVSPVKIKPGRSVLSIFQCIDFSILQGITAASVSKNFHRMCNGANLAYEKEIFYSVNGFENIDHIASGDDMLLMDKIAARYPGSIAYLNNTEAIVETLPAESWKAFFNQRIRWASKAGSYKDKRIIAVLVLVYALNLCLLVLLLGGLLYPEWFFFFLIAVFYKTIIEWRFVQKVLQYFTLQKLMLLFPLFQPLHIVYTVIAGFWGSTGSYTWKGRKVK